MKQPYFLVCALLWGGGAPAAETRIDLRTQSKGVDLSNQPTKTTQVGSELPQTCGTGQTFILTTATPGKNLYLCLSGAWKAVAGEVNELRGRPLSDTAPADGETLRWRSSTAEWAPLPPMDAGPGISISGSMVSVDDAVVPMYYTGTAAPAMACVSGRDYYVDTANGDLYFCANSAWKKTGAGPAAANPVRSFGVTIDAAGAAIAPGQAGYVTVAAACTITGWSVVADLPGSIVVEIDKRNAGIPNTTTDKISASAPPSLAGAQLAQSTGLAGWTTAVGANDVIGFNVTSAATITRATVLVNCQ